MPIALAEPPQTGLRRPLLVFEIAFASGPMDTSQLWTDVTKYLRSVTWKRGKQHVLGNYEPGTLSAICDARDRVLDPTNPSSPYSGQLDINKRVRLRAQWNLLTAAQAGSSASGGWTPSNATLAYTGSGFTLTAVAAGDMSAQSTTGTSGFPVDPGRTYTVMATFTYATIGRHVQAEVSWYDATGTSLGSDIVPLSATTDNPSVVSTASLTPPATAATGAASVFVRAAAMGEVHTLSHIGVFPSWGITTWDPGGPIGLFLGFLDSVIPDYPDKLNADVTIAASDGLRILNTLNLASTQYPDQVVADGATDFWRLNEPSGATSAIDQVVAGNAGTYHGQVILGATTQGHSPALDPSTPMQCSGTPPTAVGWASVPTAAALHGTGAFSLEVWASVDPTFGAGYQGPMWDQFGAAAALELDTFEATPGTAPVLAHFGISQGATFYGFTGTKPIDIVSTGLAYSHIVLARAADGITYKLYVNGVLDTTHVVGTALDPSPGSSPLLSIGTSQTYATANSTGFFGSLADMALYQGIELTPTQIAHHYALGRADTWSQEVSGTRVGHVLDAVGWLSADRNIGAGVQQVVSPGAITDTLWRASTLSYLQDIELAERGELFVDGAGRVTFLDREWPITSPGDLTLYTFGDLPSGGEIPYLPKPTLSLDNIDLYNWAIITRSTQSVAQAQDKASRARYGVWVTYSADIRLLPNDLDTQGRATFEVQQFAYPLERVRDITIDPNGDPSSMFPAVLRLELGDRITVKRRPPGGGDPFVQGSFLEYITHTVDSKPSTWKMSLHLDPAVGPGEYWVLDDPTASILGSTTRLSF